MYGKLREILGEAYDQASTGKGAERHADGEKFENQPILRIARAVGGGFPAGQGIKKIQEAMGAYKEHPERAIKDLLGAINYTAAAIIYVREQTNTALGQIRAEYNVELKGGLVELQPADIAKAIKVAMPEEVEETPPWHKVNIINPVDEDQT